MGMSIRRYAASRGSDPKTIRRKIAEGVIVRDADGLIDPHPADESWNVARRASRLGQHQDDDAGRRSARAKVAVTMSKLRLLKEDFETQKERYLDRAEVIETHRREADYILESLRAVPAAYAETFAAQLHITPDLGREILDQFMTLVLAELGDIRRQAVRDAERA
jgi:hypothetical protein